MKRTLIASAAGALLLTGCSSTAEESAQDAPAITQAATETTTASATTTTMMGTPLNDRGNRVKAFGELSGTGCGDTRESCAVQWALSAPIDATGCSEREPSENGKVIAIPISVQTGTGQDLGSFTSLFNPYGFSVLRADGVTQPQLSTGASYQCAESDVRVPDGLAPASSYEGFVVLDVPIDAQSIIFRPDPVDDGWEWPLN